MKEETQHPKVPLKGGGEIEVRAASAWGDLLRSLLEKHPQHFEALLALSEARKEDVSQASIVLLRKWGYLAKDLTPHPDVCAVLRAAYRPNTPDGPCIVDPLDLKSEQDATVAKRHEEETKRRTVRLGRRLIRKDDDKGRTPG